MLAKWMNGVTYAMSDNDREGEPEIEIAEVVLIRDTPPSEEHLINRL